MVQDRYTAVWVSHSSISDWLNCPRAYYLKNVYRDPKTGHKIKLISPPLALGQVVHQVLESLSVLPVAKRFDEPLLVKFDQFWQKVSAKKGGFVNAETEDKYKERGKAILRRATSHPGPLARKAIKISSELPYFWLSEEDNIILCGKIDWLEYLPETDEVHIIDFKTSQTKEDRQSLQLPIYYLLTQHCQKRQVKKASYWYLALDDELTEKKLPDLTKAKVKVLKIAKQIKLARQLNRFKCPHKNGCYACRPMEAIIRGEAELVGHDSYNNDIYILDRATSENKQQSEIL